MRPCPVPPPFRQSRRGPVKSGLRAHTPHLLMLVAWLSATLHPFIVAGPRVTQKNRQNRPAVMRVSPSRAATGDEEEKFRAIPRAENLREYMRVMAAEPHHLGSPAGKRVAEWIRDRFRSWGLKAELETYDVLFPTPRERAVELVAPLKYTALLREPALDEDGDSGDAGQLPTYNAYAGDGDVTAPLVYVNYGVPADYEQLARMGVDVRGKIVIARYGASWRGIKPKVAYEHGAVGCLIYSDPRDDGYYAGITYPEGPYRPEHGAQRGSVMDMPIHPGDPLTPGYGATRDAKRLPREEAKTILKIPVLPISWGDALPLLRTLKGAVVPDAWKGALPMTYRVGDGTTKVHLQATFDWNTVTLYNVIARIDGNVWPDEWIIRGNHHDAWVNGADDPVSGMATVMEEARAFGEMLRQGWRPKRTILFCAWDGEEQGLLGSTEWAEHHAKELREKAVAYINSDATGRGWLGMSGSHTLEHFINDVARAVNDPKEKKTLSERLQTRRAEGARTDEEKREARERADLRIGALGSGSDYTPFLDHLGIASLNLGMSGAGGGGVYHSIYDSFAWYTRFSDGDFTYGRALVQAAGTATMRLAGADILPFEFTAFADTVGRYAAEIAALPQPGAPQPVNLKPLQQAIEKLRRAASGYDRALAGATRAGARQQEIQELNKLLYQSERRLLSETGLPRRPWFRHQIYAPGFYTGYGVKTLPGVREAIEEKQWNEANEQALIIGRTLDKMTEQIDLATAKLRSF
ncbi:MAG: transferrin receptor-like dimerization domain-containing protein [Blastocatellia bacterium]